MFTSRLLSRLLAAAALFTAAALSHAQPATAPLRIGVIPSVANEATEKAIALARDQGLNVQLVELSDWLQPNVALVEGSIDANFFQHYPFLERFNQSRGTKLKPIAYGYSTTIGLFSRKLKKGDAVPDGATIAVLSDPVNNARSLLLLESAGLIKLKPGVGHLATQADITDNPKKLKIVPIEGAQSARVFDDVTAVVTYTTFAKHAGIDEKDGLAFDNTVPENVKRYAIRWVTTPERENDARLRKFISIYQQSPEVKQILRRLYGDLIDFPW
ncbi:MetQ/NlpA family ABC transporter substrate-binding protein [Xylophilus sp.]|uniref:MetQ/NlpA family ABC transporter substrate-binding protein n=1 Tax=Xylophilus sp. TaxID=2653893 RepID=UPI0013B68A80|nr:MetQ/NlpA family ABC transporter substrate-binding protein [Xylophilus sp.]KAF1044549.1 MAG: D-methionine-binding lipoprotein MetQ [Xylophilus sp.]